ncbi:hypothetical protein LCGC14_0692520 [marine sediment metagenome]|uniref:P/Homo B domain-containing protein n=1 Tax=marine sediment metagenome TaxID=412755 RepID=A0A0F9T6A2_9ZZZZ|nr:hypothetical protein [Phycisphaerae bacterium]HDZ42719.1 hypothetical protein [Phycisphaerae bacterium]
MDGLAVATTHRTLLVSVLAIWLTAVSVRAEDQPDKADYIGISTLRERYSFVPNDPYFHRDTPSAGWPGQWHLINEHVAGLDAGVQGAWDRDFTGVGVIIGIVDDSLETTHPDLAPNYVAADSWDFGQNDPVPDPVVSADRHGISVAGVAAARGGNGVGVTGAAPYAGLAGLRIDFDNQTEQMFIDATLYHSSGANTNIDIKNHSYGIAAAYIHTPAETQAFDTSAAAGTVHVLAAGNERSDANKKDIQNNPNTITVAALGSNGTFASYSNYGASVFVTAPSSGSSFGITTTDRTGSSGYNPSDDTFPDLNYTSVFGGTSSASPLAAGVLALVKQAQPDLDVRFAKHLLAMTSDIVDAADATDQSDGGWRTNAAGYAFNQNYGFGLIDADELTQIAGDYVGILPLTTESSGTIVVEQAIPDNNAAGIVRTFELTASTPLEELLVTLDITHTWHSDINITLTSPSGTTSRLVAGREGGAGQLTSHVWEYTSNVFWGEDPQGIWTIQLADIWRFDSGTWHSFSALARMGELLVQADLDADGDVDADDIDILCANLGSVDPQYDMDGDGDADADDLVYMVENLVELADGSGRIGTAVGDFDLDGLVGATDLAIMKANFAQTGQGWAEGNANCDNIIDATDLAILKASFGFTAPAAGSAGLTAGSSAGLTTGDPIPEPMTAILLAVGALLPISSRRRNR